jgi:hypothetical protein
LPVRAYQSADFDVDKPRESAQSAAAQIFFVFVDLFCRQPGGRRVE